MRQRYECQGLWGLIDHRNTRLATPFGRVDERVVEAIAAARDEQTTPWSPGVTNAMVPWGNN